MSSSKVGFEAGQVTSLLAASAAVLPEQFYGPPARQAGRGETALMRAVLEEAVDCFQKQFVNSGRRAQRLAREAEEWFIAEDPSWPFSFVNICEVLGIEPGYIRLRLKRCSEEAAEREPEEQSQEPFYNRRMVERAPIGKNPVAA
jgi:hypothetical protein